MPNISKKSMYKLLAADLDGTLVNEEKKNHTPHF
jgi:hydroxymethylpyrimidine pyrophosphatase-like HAD family hydrolase